MSDTSSKAGFTTAAMFSALPSVFAAGAIAAGCLLNAIAAGLVAGLIIAAAGGSLIARAQHGRLGASLPAVQARIQEIADGRYDEAADEESADGVYGALGDAASQLAKRKSESAAATGDTYPTLSALDCVTANVMIADTDLNVVYVNQAAETLFKDIETDLKPDLPSFRADRLIGECIDVFHKVPSHLHSMLAAMQTSHDTVITVGGRKMRVLANPVFTNSGERRRKIGKRFEPIDQLGHRYRRRLGGVLTDRIEAPGSRGCD